MQHRTSSSTRTAYVFHKKPAKTHHSPSRVCCPTADVLFRLIALLLAAAATGGTRDAATSPPTPKAQNVPTLAQERNGEATVGLHHYRKYLTKMLPVLGSVPLKSDLGSASDVTEKHSRGNWSRPEPGATGNQDRPTRATNRHRNETQTKQGRPDIPPQKLERDARGRQRTTLPVL